jgi:AcrR family transcriptional regulator
MAETQRSAGRPRDAKVDTALLTSTQDLLLEEGFDRVSVDSVAARAGVGKAAIYRRWSGKTALVVAAVAELNRVPPVPDTGGLREDLLACARTFVRNERTQRVLAGLMTAMVHDDELRTAAHDALGGPFTRLFSEVMTRAVERGQALASADAEAVSQVFPALAFHRGAALGLPVDEEFVVRVVDNLLMPLLRPNRTS